MQTVTVKDASVPVARKPSNDSEISSFVCLPSLPDWAISMESGVRRDVMRRAIYYANAEIDPLFFAI